MVLGLSRSPASLESIKVQKMEVKTHVGVFTAASETKTLQGAPLAVTGTPVETLNLEEVGGTGLHCSSLCPEAE